MTRKLSRNIPRTVAALFALFLMPQSLFLQKAAGNLEQGHPEIAGIYEMTAPGTPRAVMQLYFKDGTLRTVEEGAWESAAFTPVAGEEFEFTRTSTAKGTYRLNFLPDQTGQITAFRLRNETQKLDASARRIGGLNDAQADPASPSDRQGYFERHYSKAEYRVPMRDGVTLFTQVYSPIDNSEPHPVILFRTPYGLHPYGAGFPNTTIPSLYFCKENYILVYQDIRGRSMSGGRFEFIRPYVPGKKTPAQTDESSDAWDTVAWLLENVPGHNGRVGIWGISYAGFTAAMGAIDAHPAVKAVSIQAPMADLFRGDDGHHNGALYLAHAVEYLYTMGQPRPEPGDAPPPRLRYPGPDGYALFLGLGPLQRIGARFINKDNEPWNSLMAHETCDAYWRERSLYPRFRAIRPAVLTVGGWYDAEDLHGTLGSYRAIEKQNPGLINTLVMGPWRHSGWSFFAGGGEDRGVFPFRNTRAYFHEKLELAFFNRHLKETGAPLLPEAVVFETGSDEWRCYDSWPPAAAKKQTLFFAENGALSAAPPVSARFAHDEYTSDPAKPVPYTMQTVTRCNRDYFVEDQRFAACRPDVLVYTGAPLSEDSTISGPIEAELFVSTSGTDSDWVVKVIDVYPDDSPDPENNPRGIRMGGFQRLVRGEIMRGKFRDSFASPKPFVPGRVTRVAFELPDVQHTFRKGHRIMVQVQSSWFPLFDRNPQTFCNIRAAGAADFRKATQRIYRSGRYPSGISFRALSR